MIAKRFFYGCAGLLCLATAYHFGATSATAQAPGNPVVAAVTMNFGGYVVTASGDVYRTTDSSRWQTWTHVSNVFSGGPTRRNASRSAR